MKLGTAEERVLYRSELGPVIERRHGKIFVLNVEQAMRVRTGESGDDAL